MKYTISILAVNCLELTRRCVDSILAAGTGADEAELILTDNGSGPELGEYFDRLVQTHANIRVVRNSANCGFIEPNRRALAMAQSEFFVMLNNDATVPPRWLEMLAEPFADPKAGLCGPLGGCCTLQADFKGCPGAKLEYLEGSCLMGRTALLREVGLFSQYLHFAYGEDSDLSLRLSERGYTLHHAPFTLGHTRAATCAQVRAIPQIQARNHAVLIRRWAGYLKTRRFDTPLIVRRMGAWGDVLLTTPIIRALKAQRPHQPIYVETACPEIFLGNPHVTMAGAVMPAMQDAVRINLDMAYENRTCVHIVDAFAEVAMVKADRKLELFVGLEALAWAKAQLPGPGWAVVHEGPGKEWIFDRWLAVKADLRQRGFKLLEFTPAGTKIDGGPFGSKPSVQRLAAMMARCRLFVGIDSFPLHVAQAVGTPVVGIFGPTSPEFILTAGSKAIGVAADPDVPCAGERHRVVGMTYSLACDGNCMRSITTDKVLAAVEEILK